MLQCMLADIRLGGEVVFIVEQCRRLLFQIIPMLDTTVTDGDVFLHVLSSSADYSAEY